MIVLCKENSTGIRVERLMFNLDPHDGSLNINEEQRISIVTTVAAISRGKDESKNPASRYKKLCKEAAPNMSINEIKETDDVVGVAGRPLEFLPVKVRFSTRVKNGHIEYVLFTEQNGDDKVIVVDESIFLNDIMPFSYLKNGELLTNMRTLLNAGMKYDMVPFNNITNYHIVKVTAPYFAFAQIRTHGRISQVAVSERVVKEDKYWLPEDVVPKIISILTPDVIEALNLNCIGCDGCRYGDRLMGAMINDDIVEVFLRLQVSVVQELLKLAGYKKEVYDRWPNHLKMKTWIMGAYMDDPKAWPHFLLEREAYPDVYKSWVQETTKEVACLIKDVLIDK